MSPDKLIRMANQIATFFKTQPGDDAPAKVAAHITDFWEPRMRAQLCAHAEVGGAKLDDVVLKAIRGYFAHSDVARRDPARGELTNP
ncbi:MAG: formate dehydrogenase subunit delta [Sedimentitalea sp.]|uniref:formate dehydrogenase subunit delta n=1 Tax=Sedimentitalea sp. TaxID=2048915 RepID=UPI0032636DA9